MEKTYLFRFLYRGTYYYFTNRNTNYTTVMTYSDYSLASGTVFSSINIRLTSSLVMDGSLNDNPITIEVDAVAPFNIISLLDKTIDCEIFKLDGTRLTGKWKGEISKYKKGASYTLTGVGLKNRFKKNIPIITVGPKCWKQTYGEHCGLATTFNQHQIVITTSEGRYIAFNFTDHAAQTTRQQYLDTLGLGNAYEGGYIGQGTLYITIEEEQRIGFTSFTTGTATNKINLYSELPNANAQEVELYNGTTFVAYATLSNVSPSTTNSYYKSITLNRINTGFDNMVFNYFLTKSFANISNGIAYAVEGDNHSYEHCKYKMLNEENFGGHIDFPDRNPVLNKVVDPVHITQPYATEG
jgi:hypothetical protein